MTPDTFKTLVTQPSSCCSSTPGRPIQRSRRLLAFTLVEMLLVVALITLLISMLLPALSRDGVKRARCMTNIRTQCQAFAVYAVDNSGIYPTADKTTTWNLHALYIMDSNIGLTLNAYGLTTNQKNGSPGAATIETPWHCPATTRPRLYVPAHATGVLHLDNYIIQTGLPAASQHSFSRLAQSTPKRSSNPLGVMTADHTYLMPDGTWTSNHRDSSGYVAGMNQGYSDASVRWTTPKDLGITSLGATPAPDWSSGWPWAWAWANQ